MSSLTGQSVTPYRLPDSVSPRAKTGSRIGEGLFFAVILGIFLFLIIVLPNSLRPVKLLLFPALALTCLARKRFVDAELFIAWLLIAMTSLFYLVYPPQPKLTPILFAEIGFVFVASPLFWILMCDYIVERFSFTQIKHFLYWCTLAAMASVLIFYYLFLNYGAEAVSVFIAADRANAELDMSQGDFSVTMHVFGSLIFVGPAFLATDTLGLWRKAIVFVALVTAAILSGRDAFLLCLAVGIAVFLLMRILDVPRQKLSLTAVVVLIGALGVFFTPFGLAAVETVLEKIRTFGGPERQLQFDALWAGIHEDWLLGAGHTGYVEFVRDPEKPWRYELLPMALIYRVGLIGFLIYAYPVLSSFWRYGQLVVARRQNQVDLFFATGLLTTLIATMTNPYLASFEFQWCLFLPYCYFYRRTRSI